MGGCCSNSGGEDAFEPGGTNDLSNGPVTNRRCTDCLFVPLFVAAQVLLVVVTAVAVADGDPTKLYKPRDYRGSYCGVADNWNGGPNTEAQPALSYTMNVSATVDTIMKQMLCSSFAQQALLTGDGTNPPLLSSTEQAEYRCRCCLSPCGTCSGSLDNGGDLDSAGSITSVIGNRLEELTSFGGGGSLFSPLGANSDFFGADFWLKATSFFNTVCVSSCDTDFRTIAGSDGQAAARTYIFEPGPESEFFSTWEAIKNAPSSALTSAMQTEMQDAFTFQALPFSACPYDASRCVPFPAVEFSEVSAGYCTFALDSDAVALIGETAASAYESLGSSSFASLTSVSLGSLFGDLLQAADTLVLVAAISFAAGLAFLVLLRFFVKWFVWAALWSIILALVFGGFLVFVLSGQCLGDSLQDASQQTLVALWQTTSQVAGNTLNGVSERLTGDGADYRGAQTMTVQGLTCLPWDTQTVLPTYNSANYPDAALEGNFCRNPYLENDPDPAKTIWCITGDPTVQWQECSPIGVIQQVCQTGYIVESETGRTALYWCSFVLWALALIAAIVICCTASQIRLAIVLNAVAANFVGSNPGILVVPVVQAVLGIIGTMAWVFSVAFLLTQVPDAYTPKGYYATYAEAAGTTSSCWFWETGDQCAATPGACTDRWPAGSVWRDTECLTEDDVTKCWRCAPPRFVLDERVWASLFVFLWDNAFNIALGELLIAMAVGFWFFSAEKGKTPVVMKSIKLALRYNVGSVALGSLLVAIVQYIRAIIEYLQKQAEAQKNRVVVCILKCLGCCVWCFEKCLKFLNRNAYIQVALLGKPFCTSARTAFFLILRNIVRFGALSGLTGIIRSIGFLAIMAGSTFAGYLLISDMHPDVSPVLPVIAFAGISRIVASLYMNVFGIAVDSSLQCFLAVEEMGVGGDLVPPELQDFVDDAQRGFEKYGRPSKPASAPAASVSAAASAPEQANGQNE